MAEKVVEVVIENASPTFDKPYTYIVPNGLENTALPGVRVRVPFGRGNSQRTGLILGEAKPSSNIKLKKVVEVIDDPPLLSPETLGVLFYLKEHTFCNWFDAFRLLIPSGLNVKPKILYSIRDLPEGFVPNTAQSAILDYLKHRGRPISEGTVCHQLAIESDNKELLELLDIGILLKTSKLEQQVMDEKIAMISLLDENYPNLTEKQMIVLDFIKSEAPVSLKETLYYTGVTRSVIDNLERYGAIGYYEDIVSRRPHTVENPQPVDIQLSPQQQDAYNGIKSHTDSYNTTLLYGVTGAGKTQVFLKLIEDTLAKGKSAIVMVPEISLTSQTVRLLQNQFGELVAVMHSGLALGERNDEWKRIKEGKARVVVGTRSAVFAPAENLGLIVIDEEQDSSYKSDRSPRFHARDIAQQRMKNSEGLLLLCSATPSVESYYYAQNGRYNFYTLTDRYGTATLPVVGVIDMSDTRNIINTPYLSQHLLEEMYYNLEHGEQSILLLNRRGYSTVIKCADCGEVAECPQCSVAMTYHSENNSLTCHYCGQRAAINQPCTTCGGNMAVHSGIGTQKLEQELQKLFTSAKILRMDMDTTMTKDSHRKMVEAFANKEYDILIGTQMVAKGFNFPAVTLVGVVNADQSLYADDFRSYERSFALFTQVVGRAGRGESAGRAMIQTHTPQHPVIELASSQNYPDFYKDEIITRKLHLYPPFCTLAGFGFVGANHKETQRAAEMFAAEFKRLAAVAYPESPLRILGPAPNEILKIADKFRYKLIIKCRNDKKTRNLFENMLKWFYKNVKKVSISIDMHYDKT